jgi:hypothetical protein
MSAMSASTLRAAYASPERVDTPTGGVVNVPAGTPLQSANHGDVDVVVYASPLAVDRHAPRCLDNLGAWAGFSRSRVDGEILG